MSVEFCSFSILIIFEEKSYFHKQLVLSPQKASVVQLVDEEGEVDPDYVISSEDREESLEYRYGYMVVNIKHFEYLKFS